MLIQKADFDLKEFSSLPIAVRGVLEYVNTSQKAILTPAFAVKFVKPVVCEIRPELAEILGNSKTLFAPGVFTMFTNISIDPALRLWINYLIGTVIGTGLMQSTISQIANRFVPDFSLHPYVGRVCDGNKDHSEPLKAFGMNTFDPIFRAYAILICFALFALLIERRMIKIVRALTLLFMQYDMKLHHWIPGQVKKPGQGDQACLTGMTQHNSSSASLRAINQMHF